MSKLNEDRLADMEVALYRAFDKIDPSLYSAGVTANHITIASALCGVGSLVAFWKEWYGTSGTLFTLSQILDAHDGYYARKYNMVSNMGDILDHGSDVFVGVGLLWVLWATRHRFSPKEQLLVAVWYIAFIGIAWIQMSCSEKMYRKQEGSTYNETVLTSLTSTVGTQICNVYQKSAARNVNILSMSMAFLLICLYLKMARL